MDILRQEFRYAFRWVRRTPLASAIVIATLGVGIALVTTFFSLVNTAFFHPLPYPHANRTIALSYYAVHKLPVDELRKMTRSLSRIGTTIQNTVNVTGGSNAIYVKAAEVDTAIFPILGVAPVLGSLPTPAEIASRARVVVINEPLWRKRFGGAPDVIGKTMIMDDVPRTIVAVMPRWFDFPMNVEAWFPMETQVGPKDQALQPVGLLADGATRADVQRELVLLGARLNQIDPSTYHVGRTGGLYALRDMVDRGRDKGPITMMVLLTIGGAVCVLLVACTNVASVMLARAARRRGEMAIRASIGASRWQMIRQQILESTILATAAGATGTLLSLWGIRLVIGMLPPIAQDFFPGWASFGIDANVFAFAAAVSLLTILIFGLWPAREATRFNLTSALRGADPGVAGEDPTKRVHLPVVLELTFSLPLFVGAVLMLRSFGEIANADRGYAVENRSRVRLFYVRRDSVAADYTRLMRGLHERLSDSRMIGDVALEAMRYRFPADTSYTDHITLAGSGRAMSFYGDLSGAPIVISDNFFAVMGMRIVSGRPFGPSDNEFAPIAAIVSRRFATEAWGAANPLGQQLVVSKNGVRATVVGVASDRSLARNEFSGVRAAREVFFSARQSGMCCGGASLVVHSPLTATALNAALTQTLRDLGQERPVTIESFESELERQQLMPRMFSSILGTFATAGLILAIMGIYGVVAFAVEQRTREIGVRIALGATAGDVIRHVMRGGLKLVAIAIVLGLLASAAIGRVLTAFVSGSTTSHILTALLVAIGFGAIAAAACWVPARRAAALDPLKALRAE